MHDETGDRPGMGFKSMSLAVSQDDRLSWRRQGQIITGNQPLTQGRITSEGDCMAVDGQDSFYYAYCLRNRDQAIIVARAPVTGRVREIGRNTSMGHGASPVLAGCDDTPKGVGIATAYWRSASRTVNLGGIGGGLGVAFSADHVTFTPLAEPLVPKLNGTWRRPGDPNELLTYWSLLDRDTGLNQLSNHWLLAYTDIQPDEGFAKRYLVVRPIEVSWSHRGKRPQVGILLARWRNARLHDRWSTTAAVPGNYVDYRLDGKLGYLLTLPDPSGPSVELEDCFSQWPGHPDHMLEQPGFCDAGKYRRLRTTGWVYAKSRPGTVALYRCYNAQERTHFASNAADCEGLGVKERLLGLLWPNDPRTDGA